MDLDIVIKELERMGTAQNRKVYSRHGVSAKTFGVSYANLGKLKKKIQTDQALAQSLWTTGIHDARILATMVADPGEVRSAALNAWARDLDSYVVADAVAKLAAGTPFARGKMQEWTASKNEWKAYAGWTILAILAMKEENLSEGLFEMYLGRIESGIGKAKNYVRHGMNNALIAVGIRSPDLEKKALAAARRIGKVEVDHGETGCKTPDAVQYILKVKTCKGRR